MVAYCDCNKRIYVEYVNKKFERCVCQLVIKVLNIIDAQCNHEVQHFNLADSCLDFASGHIPMVLQ